MQQRVGVPEPSEVVGRQLLGANVALARRRRPSGTLTTPTFIVKPPKPPVSAWPRVNVLKTVVLPLPVKPTIAICTARQYPAVGSTTFRNGCPAR